MQQRMLKITKQVFSRQPIQFRFGQLIMLVSILVSLVSCEISKERILDSTRKSCKAFVQTIEVHTLQQTQMSALSNQPAAPSNQPTDIQESTTIWSDIESGRTW